MDYYSRIQNVQFSLILEVFIQKTIISIVCMPNWETIVQLKISLFLNKDN